MAIPRNAEHAEGKPGEIAIFDPRMPRALALVDSLAERLRVVHFTDIENLDRYCAKANPVLVVVALQADDAQTGDPADLSVALLRFLRTRGRQQPVVAYARTDELSIEFSCQALAAGARQIVNEQAPTFLADLGDLLVRLVHDDQGRKQERQEIAALFAKHGIHGQSLALQEVCRKALKVSRFSDLPVLLLGETGTGKQRLAEAIHALDPRRHSRPFLTLNCSALSKGLAESELFGHARGAFSGAQDNRLGLFRAANGGTLFLDEIGELDLELQPKLLRVLQERKLLPVGEDVESPLDIRIIAATNRPLQARVAEGKFREDLFHRLNVFHIRIPPLRERLEDIPVQALHFLHLCQAGQAAPLSGFGAQVLEAMKRLPWEGNSRQLQNMIREALAQKEGGQLLEMEDLPLWVLEKLSKITELTLTPDTLEVQVQTAWKHGIPLNKAVEEYERRLLQIALREHGGNRTRVAEVFGLTPRTIFNKIKKYGLEDY